VAAGQREKEAREKAEAAEQKEKEALRLEEAANGRTREREASLMKIVRKTIFKVQDDLRHIPAVQATRQEILKEVQDQLGAVAKEMDQDPFVDRYTAATHAQLGDILLKGGRTTEAQKRYEQAHALMARRRQDHPDDPLNTR